MKTNKIIRKESVNGGCMFSLTFELPINDFDIQQAGRVLNTWKNGVSYTSTDLEVGDAITDETGGEPVIAEVHGKTETTILPGRKESDYRTGFENKGKF